MPLKPMFTASLILLGLVGAVLGGYAVGNALPDLRPASTAPHPLLSPLPLPVQTDGPFTAEAVSYYADASRLIFHLRITGEPDVFVIDGVDLYDSNGEFINSSVGYGRVDENDPALHQFEFNPVTPLPNRLLGSLRFRIVAVPGVGEPLAEFSFDLDLPVHPAQTYNPQSTTTANDLRYPPDAGSKRAQHAVPEDDLYKSPVNLLCSKDGSLLYAVCEDSDEVACIEVAGGKVLSRTKVGRHPFGIAASPEGKRIYVSNRWGGSVSVLEPGAEGKELKLLRPSPSGTTPTGSPRTHREMSSTWPSRTSTPWPSSTRRPSRS